MRNLISVPGACPRSTAFGDFGYDAREEGFYAFDKGGLGGTGDAKDIRARIHAHNALRRQSQLKADGAREPELASEHEHQIGKRQQLVDRGNIATFAIEAEGKRMILGQDATPRRSAEHRGAEPLGKFAHQRRSADRSLTHDQNRVFRAHEVRHDCADIGDVHCVRNHGLGRDRRGSGTFERLRRPFNEYRSRLAFESEAYRLSELRLNVLRLVDAKRALDQRRRHRLLIDRLEMEPVIRARRATDDVHERDRVLCNASATAVEPR